MDFKGFCFRISKERGRVLQCEDRCQCRHGVAAGCHTPTGGSGMSPLFSDFPCVGLDCSLCSCLCLCPPVQDGNLVAQDLGLVHVVRWHQDRPVLLVLEHQVPDVPLTGKTEDKDSVELVTFSPQGRPRWWVRQERQRDCSRKMPKPLTDGDVSPTWQFQDHNIWI